MYGVVWCWVVVLCVGHFFVVPSAAELRFGCSISHGSLSLVCCDGWLAGATERVEGSEWRGGVDSRQLRQRRPQLGRIVDAAVNPLLRR